MAVQFRLLGEVSADIDGRPVELGHARQRCVLAVLLLEANRIVPVATLAERVWGERLPPSRYSALYSYLSRLRTALAGAVEVGIVRAAGGYRLAVDQETVDLFRFQQRVALARTADDENAVALFDEALRLWHGDAFAGLEMPWVQGMREILHGQRLAARLDRNDVRLRRGDRAGVLDELFALSAEHPRDERLAAQLMLALYHAGRTTEALEHYQMLRRRLAEEMGVDPGPALDRLRQDILRGTVESHPGQARPRPGRLVPRQLPAPPQMFTGRVPELARLGQVHDASTAVITAVDGMAGVGKTALAVRAAHQIADRYPDGQMFIDLHGFTRGVDPVEPGEALDHLLRSLGVPGPQIPESLDQRAALYRTLLADQRILVVLDNAATESQVVPLLPGGTQCLVLVTSRRRLSGLDHTLTLSLDTMPVPDAVALFTRSVGEGRLDEEPAERLAERLAELVELAGRLPLAIRIAAARLRSHPTWRLHDLVARLRDRQHRLGELETGQRSVTVALDMSYHHLDPDQQRAYRLLGLHPGPDVDAYATAALLDSKVAYAGRLLDRLHDAHLLQEPAPGRYRFHDLTRSHAAQIAGAPTDPGDQGAVGRLLGYYRHTASAAMDAAYPYEREYRPHVSPARTPIPGLPDALAALSWLDTELPNLMATARHADHDQPEHTGYLSDLLHRDLDVRGRYHEAEALHQQALLTARATGHRAGQMCALTRLGRIHRLQGRFQQAADHLEQALRIAQAIDHRPGQMDALSNLGCIHQIRCQSEQAIDHFQRALRIAQAIDHRPGQMDALIGLGNNHRQQGRYEQATDHFQRAWQIAHATGHQSVEQYTLTILGSIHQVQGRYEQATDHLERAWQMAQVNGNRRGELIALTILSAVHRLQGRYEQATHYYHRLDGLAHQTGDRNFEFEAIQGLGRLLSATGEPAAAIDHHHRALMLAGELDQPGDQARAYDGLAHAHHALNQPEQARAHWLKALEILTGLGLDYADDAETTVAAIRAHLTGLHLTPRLD